MNKKTIVVLLVAILVVAVAVVGAKQLLHKDLIGHMAVIHANDEEVEVTSTTPVLLKSITVDAPEDGFVVSATLEGRISSNDPMARPLRVQIKKNGELVGTREYYSPNYALQPFTYSQIGSALVIEEINDGDVIEVWAYIEDNPGYVRNFRLNAIELWLKPTFTNT